MRETKWEFFIRALGAFVICTGLILFFYSSFISKKKLEKMEYEQSLLLHGKACQILRELKGIKADLLFLGDALVMHHFSSHSSWIINVQRAFYTFALSKPQYTQIRFIDNSGKEVVRINNSDGTTIKASENELQDNSGRYYMRDIKRLLKGDIYMSPFDLDVGNGKIERPHNPTIRFATRFFDERDNPFGSIILNYNSAEMLFFLQRELTCGPGMCKDVSDEHSLEHILMLNQGGYWLLAEKKSDEWGFMLNKEPKFQDDKEHGEAWQEIIKNRQGHIVNKSVGLLTFTTLYPWQELQAFPEPNSSKKFWILLSHIPPDRINGLVSPVRFFPWLLFFILLLAAMPFILLISSWREKNRLEIEHKSSMASIIEESLNEIYIFSIDNLCFLLVNRMARKNLGYSEKELLGMTPIDIKPYFTQKAFRKLLKPLTTGVRERLVFKTEHRRKNGSRYPVEVHLQRSSYLSKDVIVSIVINITSREKAINEILRNRAEFKAIFNSVSDAVILVDKKRRVTMVNRAFSELFGYELAELEGKPTDIIYANADSYKNLCENHLPPDAKPEKYVYEVEYRRKDRTIFPGETLGAEVMLEDGECLGFVEFIRDISLRKQEEKEREKNQARLQQIQKMEAVGTLAGGIAHDFNNILAVIFGFSEMAKSSIIDGRDPSNDIDQIIIASQRAEKLIRQVLTFSRKEEQQQIPLEPHLIIKESLKMLRSSIPTSVEIIQDIDTECGFIMADPTSIHQVMMNLCTNALHALEDEKGIISVSLYLQELTDEEITYEDLSPGSFIVLRVEDSGHGMDYEVIRHIFEPYFTTKGSGQGTGLGLAVVYGIVQKCNGFIQVKSTLGQGTVFHVFLPALQRSSKYHSANKKEDDNLLPKGSESILVVDDERNIAIVNKAILEKLGYRVTATTSSTDALEIIKRNPDQFDLLFTDQTMPQITGIELSRMVLKIIPEMPIIICSGYSAFVSKEKAMEAGIRRYLKKPVGRHELAQAVRKVLDNG